MYLLRILQKERSLDRELHPQEGRQRTLGREGVASGGKETVLGGTRGRKKAGTPRIPGARAEEEGEGGEGVGGAEAARHCLREGRCRWVWQGNLQSMTCEDGTSLARAFFFFGTCNVYLHSVWSLLEKEIQSSTLLASKCALSFPPSPTLFFPSPFSFQVLSLQASRFALSQIASKVVLLKSPKKSLK